MSQQSLGQGVRLLHVLQDVQRVAGLTQQLSRGQEPHETLAGTSWTRGQGPCRCLETVDQRRVLVHAPHDATGD